MHFHTHTHTTTTDSLDSTGSAGALCSLPSAAARYRHSCGAGLNPSITSSLYYPGNRIVNYWWCCACDCDGWAHSSSLLSADGRGSRPRARERAPNALIVLLRTLRVLFILQSASHAHLLCPPQVSARAVFFPLSLFFSKRKSFLFKKKSENAATIMRNTQFTPR